MATKQHRDEKRKIIYVSLIFIVLAAMYFMPASALGQTLPEKVVRFRIAYPVAALALLGAYLGMGWKFVLAFLFSCTGDAMGAYGSFFGQMGYFAAAHVMLIGAFAERLWKGRKEVAGKITGKKGATSQNGGADDFWNSRSWKTLVGLTVAAVLAFAFALVIPNVPEAALQIGCGVYAVLIAAMFWLSLMQRSPLFAVGAALFLISDMILSWNKFVGPVTGEKWLIMVPYYLGQMLIWLGAVGLMKAETGSDAGAENMSRQENMSNMVSRKGKQ